MQSVAHPSLISPAAGRNHNRTSRRAWFLLPVAAWLTLAGAGPAAHPDFQPGAESAIGAGMDLDVGGLAGIGDGSVFVLDLGRDCRTCVTAEDKANCRHKVPQRILHFLRETSEGDNTGSWRHTVVANTTARPISSIKAGPRGVLILELPEGLTRAWLVPRKDSSWEQVRQEPLLTRTQITALGLPLAGLTSYTIHPDGRIIMGLARSVVMLPAAADVAGRTKCAGCWEARISRPRAKVRSRWAGPAEPSVAPAWWSLSMPPGRSWPSTGRAGPSIGATPRWATVRPSSWAGIGRPGPSSPWTPWLRAGSCW